MTKTWECLWSIDRQGALIISLLASCAHPFATLKLIILWCSQSLYVECFICPYYGNQLLPMLKTVGTHKMVNIRRGNNTWPIRGIAWKGIIRCLLLQLNPFGVVSSSSNQNSRYFAKFIWCEKVYLPWGPPMISWSNFRQPLKSH